MDRHTATAGTTLTSVGVSPVPSRASRQSIKSIRRGVEEGKVDPEGSGGGEGRSGGEWSRGWSIRRGVEEGRGREGSGGGEAEGRRCNEPL